MKTNDLLITGTGLLLAAAALLVDPSPAIAPAAVEARKPSKVARHAAPTHAAAPHRFDRSTGDADEAANLTAWQQRFDQLLHETGNRDAATTALLAEIGTTYHSWVQEQVAWLAERPPSERYDEIADIERSVNEGSAAILDQLAIEESQRRRACEIAADALAAEVQYAEAARDSDSRLALLLLDRERQSRLEQALAITDESAQSQAIAELDAWYESGLGTIFATSDTPDAEL